MERGQTDPTDLLERALEPLYPAQHSIQSLDDAIDAYVSDRGLPELRKAEAAAVAQFRAIFPDRRVFDMTRSDVKRWVDHLRKDRGQTGPTIRRRLGAMRAIFAAAADEADFSGANLFRSVRIPDADNGGVRLPFERSHLELINT